MLSTQELDHILNIMLTSVQTRRVSYNYIRPDEIWLALANLTDCQKYGHPDQVLFGKGIKTDGIAVD